jgi:hypothetical protein
MRLANDSPGTLMIAKSDTPAFTFALNLNADVSLSTIMETVPSVYMQPVRA